MTPQKRKRPKRIPSGAPPKMLADAGLFGVSFVLAYKLRLDVIGPGRIEEIVRLLPLIVLIKIALLSYAGCYRGMWRYASLHDLLLLGRANLLGTFAFIVAGFLVPPELKPPRGVPFIDLALSLLLTGGARIAVRMFYEAANRSKEDRTPFRAPLLGSLRRPRGRRALVFGAGDAGEMIVREMLRSPKMDYAPVAFVDDDPTKHGQSIHGVRVLGDRSRIPELVEKLAVRDIVIAVPSARGKTVQEIVEVCRSTKARLKILPDLAHLPEGTVRLSDIREVDVEDLLGREPADLDLDLISSYLRGKRILVTGAGGSIGAELCRQILRFEPAEIQLFGRGEHSIYEIHRELSRHPGRTRLVQVLGDVINKKKLEGVFSRFRPEIVFHAGADKHVPLMEDNPDEAVLNNILGTKNLLEVANAAGVERVVSISTDKAVNPTSIMGCCKRVAELLVQSRLYRNTVPVAVRFGNVLGSRGSVIPLFRKQIAEGGPVTITHRDVKRYFMTVSEAAGLVIQAGAMGSGGEIFVLDMGQPVRIYDLACQMIRLAGFEPGRDIELREVGLRPGEKLQEELHSEEEAVEPTAHPKIICVRGNGVDSSRLLAGVKYLTDRALRMDFGGIRAGLQVLVPEYRAHRAEGRLSAIASAYR